MNKIIEKCQIAGKQINSAHDLINNGLPADTTRMHYLGDCRERPRENRGPASLPECRKFCPFYTLVKA